ncbi:Ribosome biogenesis protein - Nop56p/Sik1p, partial [Pseudoloma neurophilia]
FTDITASDGSKITVDNSHVFYKEKFDIEVIQALWKIKEQNIDWINTSVGMELSDDDWNNLKRIISLFNIKKENAKSLEKYLIEKLSKHAPNLTALLGFKLAAEIISLTGSLINLSKCTAGTIQVLGAEKALFRSLKSKTQTPKYGILKNNPYTTSPRIIRSLANKIAICARIDAFSKEKIDLYGIALKEAIINKIEKDIQIDTEEILKGVSKKLRNLTIMKSNKNQ